MRRPGSRREVRAIDGVRNRLSSGLGRWLTVLGLMAVLLALTPAQQGRALDVEVSGRLVSRTLLALYDSKQEAAPHHQPIFGWTLL